MTSKEELRAIIADQLRDFNGTEMFLFICKPEDYIATREIITEGLTKNGKPPGVYATFNTPYVLLKKDLEKAGVNVKKLFFLDGISRITKSAAESEECVYIRSPSSLTELSIRAMELALTKKFDFFVVDSISAMLIHNKPERLEKFGHYILNKLRLLGIRGILIATDDERSREVCNTMSQFTTRMIKLGFK
ncbi:MAG TPA: ATPase domain-containing protein [archaeon]|nr:ATPase domain-containing protein [archaeon]